MTVRDRICEGYDEHAEEYHRIRKNPANMWFNAFIDDPAMLAILSEINVEKKDLLDVGCGSGILTAKIKRLGAKVTGVDISQKLIEIARRENPDIEFFAYDAARMGFPDSSFDVVSSAMMMHYFEYLAELFGEVNRVLRPNGDYVFSTTHPATAFWHSSRGALARGITRIELNPYFLEDRKQNWSLSNAEGGKVFENMPFYRYTVEDIVTALDKSGFDVRGIKEPRPIPEGRNVNPRLYSIYTKFPTYLTVHARKRT